MSTPNQIAVDAADEICNWLQADDDPIDTQERMKCAEIIQSAIDEAIGQRNKYWQRIAEVHDCESVTDAFVQLTNLRESRAAAAGVCDHQWTDYGTLKFGDNPTLEIEACVCCGVQRKKAPAATEQEPNEGADSN